MLKTWPMLKSLVWKEFRELLPVIVAAATAEALLVTVVLHTWKGPRSNYDVAGLQAIWVFLYAVALLFAVAAGLWQTGREALGSYYQFMLHRPLGRKAIFATKIAFGALACLFVVGVPAVWFATWALHELGLSADWFVRAAWSLFSGILLLYLGAFLSGLRPALWYGSRFIPLFAGVAFYIFLQILGTSPFPDEHLLPQAVILAAGPLIEVGFVVAIFYIATGRDFP
jgi:hypothetical protein